MAKRKAKGRTRKAARKTSRTGARKSSQKARGGARRAKSSPARRSRRPAAARKRAARPKRAAAGRKRATAGRKQAANRTRAAKPAAGKRPARSPEPAKAAAKPRPVGLQRERRRLTDEDVLPSAPSTLGYSPRASGAESGHQMYQQRQREHTEGGAALTGGDVDVNWSEAYASGDEAPGGDMPTPDQDVVEEIGRALGIEYEDAEELKGAEKVEERDRHRWEYDPASSEDYNERNRKR